MHSLQLYDRVAIVLDKEASQFLSRAGYSRGMFEERKELIGKPMSEGAKAYNSGSLAIAYSALGENRTAIKYYNEALEAFRKLVDRENEGIMLGNVGIAYANLGEKRKALEYYEDALKVHREVGNRVSEGRALGNKGATKFELGEKEEGIRLVEQALKIARQVEDKMAEEIWLKELRRMQS